MDPTLLAGRSKLAVSGKGCPGPSRQRLWGSGFCFPDRICLTSSWAARKVQVLCVSGGRARTTNCVKVAIPKITHVDPDSQAPEPARQRR